MLALRWHARQDLRLEQVEIAEHPGPGQLLLEVDAAGICGTDLHEWLSGPHTIPTTPHPLSGRCAPLILGHEFVGTVREAGPGTTIAPGQFVAVEVNTSCGQCPACVTGHAQLCSLLASHGLHDDGGLAEQVLVPESMCVPTAGLTPLEAVLAEPLAVVVRTERLLDLAPGGSVCVVGAGTIGQLTVRLFALRGHEVCVVDPAQARVQMAREHGAVDGSSPSDVDAFKLRATGGHGFDAAIDTAGAPRTAVSAIMLARPGGIIGLVGADHHPLEISPLELILAEHRVQSVLSHTMSDFRDAVSLLSSKEVSVSGLVTRVVPLTDVVEGAFCELRDNGSQHLKIVVAPDERISRIDQVR